jgi:hypothetical protein
MVISLIVAGVAFSIYRLNASAYLREDAYLQQYQNLRVALYTIGRDVRMAGNGFSLLGPDLKLMQAWTPSLEKVKSGGNPPTQMVSDSGWFRNSDVVGSNPDDFGVRAIFGVDGGADYPDTLTIFRSEVESGNPLARVKSVSGNTLTLDAPILQEALKSGDIIAIGSGTKGVVLQTGTISFSGGSTDEIPIVSGGRFTAPSGSFAPTDFPVVGSYVYNFRDIGIVTYYVDTVNNTLMAAYHDTSRDSYDDSAGTSAIVASNIEDLQVYYHFDNKPACFSYPPADPDDECGIITDDPTISSNALNNRRVKAVSVGLTARSPYGNGPLTHSRPALFNRKAGTDFDNRQRNVLIETVYLRNFNI